MFKNIASQKVAVFAWDNAAGSAKTGDAANITAQISLDGAATAATNDANPTELDAADAPGVYLFDLTQAETNADLVVIAPVSSTSDIVLRPILAYTNPITPTKAGYIDASIQTVDTVVDSILTDTADMQPRVVAIEVDTSTTLQAELDGIQADTEDIQTQIGAAGAGLSAIPWNAAWDAEVQSECADALNAYDPPTKAEMDVGHGLLATEAKQDIIDGIVDDILADTNELQTDDLPTLIAALPTAVENRTEMDNNSTQLAAIVADTNELQTDDVPGLIAALNDISVADILAGIVEGAISVDQVLQVVLAFCAGECNGGGTATINFRDQADTKNRVQLTVDADGDRSATALDLD